MMVRRVTRRLVLAAWLLLAGAAAAQTAGTPIGVNDFIFVEVYRHPEYSTTVQVDANGNINLPDAGAVRVLGLTEAEAAARVTQAYLRILRHPRVTLSRSAAALSTTALPGRTTGMRTELVPLNNAGAQSLSLALQGMSSEGGRISYYEDSNTLIITDYPEALQNMMAVIARLDRMETQMTQVRIESKIAEVQIGAMKDLGIRWFVQGDETGGGYSPMGPADSGIASRRGYSASPLANETLQNSRDRTYESGIGRRFLDELNFDRRLNIPVQVPVMGQLFLGFMNQSVDVGVMLDALVNDNKAELLANPNILTVNHKRASIEMVDEVPYTEFGLEAGGRGNFSTRFMDMGIKLEVTPHVFRDATGTYVKLDLCPEVSFPRGAVGGVPVRSVRRYSTVANVRNQQTLVVGGIFRNDSHDVEQSVPGLGDLPVLGHLFKRTEHVKSRTELMVFVTPTIHETPDSVTWDQMLDVTASALIESAGSSTPAPTQETRRE